MGYPSVNYVMDGGDPLPALSLRRGPTMMTPLRSSPGHRIRTAVVAITASLLILFPSAALAQGLPMFPDPINTKTLIQYADRLELSVDQRLALEPLHDAYLDRFRRLRDKDMQAFQDHLLDIAIYFMRSRFSIPERVELEQLIQEFEHVESKIAAVDRSLFNEVESILDDQQHLKLQRVRKQRRIEAFRTIVLEIGRDFNSGARADLVNFVEGLDLSAEEAALAEPILINYESALLKRARALHRVVKAATTDILDTIDELGLRDMTPEEMMQLGENQEIILKVQTRFDELSIPFQKAVHDISRLNLKTAREIMKLLTKDKTAELRDRYYQSAYRAVYRSPGAYRRRYAEAAKVDSIAGELAEQIRIQRDEFMRQDDQLIDDLVDALEKSREYRTMAVLSEEGPDPLEAKLGSLKERRAALLERADTTLQALVGPELFAQLADDSAPGEKGRPAEQLVAGQEPGQPQRVARDDELASDVASHANQRVKDPHLPSPISAGEIQRFVRRSNIGEGNTAVLDLLYQDYREKFDEILYAPLTAQDQTEADEPEPDDDRLLQQRLTALQDADKRFFDDVALMAVDRRQSKLVQRLRHLRRRAVHHERTRAYHPFRNDSRGGLDLVRLVYEAKLDESSLVTLEPTLDSYDSEAAPVFQERLEVVKAVDRIRRAGERASESQASSGVMAALKDKQRQETQRLFANRRRLTSVNEDHLDQILPQLPAQSAVPLRFAYYQQAYPDIYRDSREIENSIAAILRFPNLAEAQRDQIDAISRNFRSRFMEISDKGIALQREQEREAGGTSFNMPSRRMLERELQRERLEFDRDEVCARAMMHLRLALSEAQAQYIPQSNN